MWLLSLPGLHFVQRGGGWWRVGGVQRASVLWNGVLNGHRCAFLCLSVNTKDVPGRVCLPKDVSALIGEDGGLGSLSLSLILGFPDLASVFTSLRRAVFDPLVPCTNVGTLGITGKVQVRLGRRKSSWRSASSELSAYEKSRFEGCDGSGGEGDRLLGSWDGFAPGSSRFSW